MSLVILILLVLLLVGAVPAWPHSRSWGYFPSSLVGICVAVLLVMLGGYLMAGGANAVNMYLDRDIEGRQLRSLPLEFLRYDLRIRWRS